MRYGPRPAVATKLDAYKGIIETRLTTYPQLSAVRVLEESLQKIDTAIAEARAAVARDSNNAFLSRQLSANMRKKLNLLRAVAGALARS